MDTNRGGRYLPPLVRLSSTLSALIPPHMTVTSSPRSFRTLLAATVLLVSCTSSIDTITSPPIGHSGPSFLEVGTIPSMVITEFLANPDGTDDPFEWFEIFNGSGSPVNMKGMVFGSANEAGFVVNTDMFVSAGSYALFVRSASGPVPAGVPRYVYGAGTSSDKLVLNNSNTDWVTVKTTDGRLVDSLAYAVRNAAGTPGSYSSASGVARAKRAPVRDCSVAADITAWGNATTPIPGRPDKGTPGAANDVGGYSYTGSCGTTTPPPTPPPSGETISIFGRVPSDPPIPTGFQDQLFASKPNTTPARWEALTPDIATIDARGVVTSNAAGAATFRVTMADGSSRTTTLPMEVGTTGDPSLYGNNVLLGAPTPGGTDIDLHVARPQYSLSYNRSRGGPNWVAYRLTKTNRGNLPGYRCDCFATDPAVTAAGEAALTTADYTGSGFDRGHMVRSNDRELGTRDQAATYYLSNIVPQYPNLNQGRWNDFESYLQTVAEGAALPEVYILTGGRGEASRIAAGRISVPTHTWKVAVVVRNGFSLQSVDDPSDIMDVMAVDMPNVSNLPRDANWQAHRVTVDSVEKLSGYDFLTALPDFVETIVESGDRRPTASFSGITNGDEGKTLEFDASGSTDPDVGGPLGDVLSFQWSVDGQVRGTTPTLTATFVDDGAFELQLIVSDRFGWADTTTKSVTIANVAPTVGTFDGGSIIRGERYTATGGFTDPGADTWTATVNYGDGSGAQPLALAGKSFSLAHTYEAAGTFTVTVTVRDDDSGSGARSSIVVVASADEAIATLSERVSALASAGTLTRGESNALDASLRNALKSLDKDNPTPARNQLEAFVNKVDAMQRSGRLDAAAAEALISYAQRIIASIV